jgi:quercetin 2,3-dioxygenase
MFTIRRGADRGRTHIDWLDSFHTFSFGDYVDPDHHHYRALRVINDDRIAPGGGFGTHPHRDMEILTCMLAGTLSHRDSMGHVMSLHAGEWQVMSAGTGLTHSEYNASAETTVHLLQIWIIPDRRGHTPRYDQKAFAGRDGEWVVVASPDGRDGSLPIHQDAIVSQAHLNRGTEIHSPLDFAHGHWLHVATGQVRILDHTLAAGDAMAIEGEASLAITADTHSMILCFDLK